MAISVYAPATTIQSTAALVTALFPALGAPTEVVLVADYNALNVSFQADEATIVSLSSTLSAAQTTITSLQSQLLNASSIILTNGTQIVDVMKLVRDISAYRGQPVGPHLSVIVDRSKTTVSKYGG